MVAGGPYTVRGYDMGALSGDQGALLQIELRHELGKLWAGQTQVSAFIDSEHVTINHDTWTSGDNGATLSGAGVGLNWAGADQWSAKAYVAAPVGATPALIGHTNSARAWLEIDKGF
jgi:hemolysin activation/secretion protein